MSESETATEAASAEGGLGGKDANLSLPAILDLVTASGLRDSLLEHLGSSHDLAVDGQDVESASSPCIQVLVAAALSAESEGGSFKILQGSKTLEAAFTDLGLSEQYERWSKSE